MTPRLGTDAIRIGYAVRGIVQGVHRFRESPKRRTALYVTALGATAIATGVALIAAGYTLEAPFTVIALAVAAAVAERSSVRLTRTTEQSISVLPTLFAAVLF